MASNTVRTRLGSRFGKLGGAKSKTRQALARQDDGGTVRARRTTQNKLTPGGARIRAKVEVNRMSGLPNTVGNRRRLNAQIRASRGF